MSTGIEATTANAVTVPARSTLGSNVVALYALQIANYLIPLLTLPYLIRVLGAGHYGVMASAYAVVFFLVLFVDAGFNTRATRQLGLPGISHGRVQEIYAANQWIKLAQSLVALLILLLLVTTVPSLRQDAAIYIVSYMIVVGSLSFPTWLFQGLELMHFTTVCSVGGRLLATVGIFCFVHEPDDVALAALLQASATALSGALSAPIVSRRLGLSMMIPRQRLLAEIRATLRDTRILAFSEYVTSSVANSGVFVLGLFAPDAVVGVYAALEKVARSAASVFEPLLKALFPGMSGRWMSNLPDALPHSLAWTKRILFLALLAAGALYALGPLGLEVLFGRGWETQAALLRILSFWLLLGVTASVLGQFWLLARGKQSAYSRCLVAGSATQLVACLPGAAFYGIYGVVVSLVIAEFARLALFALALRDRTTRVMP